MYENRYMMSYSPQNGLTITQAGENCTSELKKHPKIVELEKLFNKNKATMLMEVVI